MSSTIEESPPRPRLLRRGELAEVRSAPRSVRYLMSDVQALTDRSRRAAAGEGAAHV